MERQWIEFVERRFTGALFSPRRPAPSPPRIEWPNVSVNAALENFEQMALQQLKTCSDYLAAGTGDCLCVRANYGTSILPSLFGADLYIMNEELDTLPTSWPLKGGIEAIRVLIDRGIPDLYSGLGERVLKMGEILRDIGRRYPLIGKYVKIYHPDLQGPMDVAEILWGSGIFTHILETPDLIHEFLNLITATYIYFMEGWDRIVPPISPTHSVHWGMIHRGHIMVREDSAMNLSPAIYSEFIYPANEILFDVYGGGAIHFCGKGDHWIGIASSIPGVYGFNLGQPELNDMEVVYQNSVDKGIALLGMNREIAEAALRSGRDLHGMVHVV